MSMTLIDIPDDPHEAERWRAREDLIEQLRTMDGLDLDDPDVMAQAWD